MKIKKYIFLSLFYFLVSIIALRHLIFTDGVIGHHWDWNISPSSFGLQKLFYTAPYLWNSVYLGYYLSFGAIIPLFQGLIGALSSLKLNGQFISKFILIFTIVFSGTSMYLFLKEILNQHTEKIKNTSAFLGSYFYALSPFLFNEFNGGAHTQFMSYVFAPLALFFYLRYLGSVRFNFSYLFLTIITLTIISISHQKLVSICLIFFLYTIFLEQKKMSHFLILISLYLLLNSFWIIPDIAGTLDNIIRFVNPHQGSITMDNISKSFLSPLWVLLGVSYWEKFSYDSIPKTIYPFTVLSAFTIIGLIFWINYKLQYKKYSFWLVLCIISLIFACGANSPFGFLVEFLFKYFPLLVIFEAPQQLMFIPTLCYSVLIGITFTSFSGQISKKNFRKLYFLSFLLISLWISSFYRGDLGAYVDVFRLAPGYLKIQHKLYLDKTVFRTLFLPLAQSPKYLSTQYQSENQGGDPFVRDCPNPVVADIVPGLKLKPFILEVEKIAYERPADIITLLPFLNIKYIILRKDILPIHTDNKNKWDFVKIYNGLRQDSYIKFTNRFEYISLWENKFFLPHIYLTTIPTLIAGDLNALVPMTETRYLDKKPVLIFTKQNKDRLDWFNWFDWLDWLDRGNNFVFKDSGWRDLAIELAYAKKWEIEKGNWEVKDTEEGKKYFEWEKKFRAEKAGRYEVYVDTEASTNNEFITNLRIRVDGRGLIQVHSPQSIVHSRKYIKVGEVEIGRRTSTNNESNTNMRIERKKKEHNIQVKIGNGEWGMEKQKIKLVLVNKKERERIDKKLKKRIENPETELCYIFEKEKGEFYVP